MHEVGLMESALEIVFDNAKQQNATRIHKVGMKVGALSGVVPDALEFAFEALVRNTIAADAVLEIELIPVTCYCPNCNSEFEPGEFSYECPQCGKPTGELRQGQELQLTHIEVS